MLNVFFQVEFTKHVSMQGNFNQLLKNGFLYRKIDNFSVKLKCLHTRLEPARNGDNYKQLQNKKK